MLMTGTIEKTIREDHLLHLRRFLEQIELDEYYLLIVEKLKVKDRTKMYYTEIQERTKRKEKKKRRKRERERERERGREEKKPIKINQ